MPKKIAIYNSTRCVEYSTIASNHLAKWLAEILDVPLCDDISNFRSDVDIAIVVNGSWLFCNFRRELWSLLNRVSGIIYVANDYAINKPYPISGNKRRYIRIANHENFDNHPAHIYLN